MFSLWNLKTPISQFDSKSTSFDDVFALAPTFLPYRRLYGKLTQEQLAKLISDAKYYHWEALDLSSCGLVDLPDELWDLIDLRILYLGNEETRFNSEKNYMFISHKIEKLKNLQVLSLSGLYGSFDNRPLDLPNLIYLNLLNCSFQQIPNAFLIPSLQGLAFHCREEELPSEITSLSNLRVLHLPDSAIKTLPEDIVLLQNLERLNLFGSKIYSLPATMVDMPKLDYLNISNTPLSRSLPPEILSQSTQEILRYILIQRSDVPKEYFNESKMIIVGQGHVGKTSLLNRLTKNKFHEEHTTEGINISKWDYKWFDENIRLNIWDFGGQEIYHSTHQFFLTRRSLYILVWDVLAEKEYGRVDYWLRTIQSLADDSPIIIVVNKCDAGIGRIDRLDMEECRSKYPQVIDIFYVSCKDDININMLRRVIKETAVKLPLMHVKWLKTWIDVRRQIEEIATEKESISYDEYLVICAANGIVDEDEAHSLAKYLHDLGIILYYHEDPLLKNLVILSSEWGTDAVYKVLDEQERCLKNRNGVLYVHDLPQIWKDTKLYPKKLYPHLLKLMEKFQLTFKIDPNTYLVAELLNNQSIDLHWKFDKLTTLSFRYDYDFLPAGIITRFIVSANQYLVTKSLTKQCWRKGAYLFHKTAKARICQFDDIANRYIQIDVIGDTIADKKELLSIIREKLDGINSRYSKIEITQTIPCRCSEDCTFMFDYQTLLKAESLGKQTVECHRSLMDVSLSSILEGIENISHKRDQSIQDLFFSSQAADNNEFPIAKRENET